MGFGEGIEECLIVTIVGKRRLSRRTPVHDMIDGSGKLVDDLTKVVRAALQNAASVAGLLITTEAMIADKPEKRKDAPAMPHDHDDY